MPPSRHSTCSKWPHVVPEQQFSNISYGQDLCEGKLRYLVVVRGEKRELSARACNWATLFLGVKNTGNWPSRLGESQMRQ
jgi:hypothetical protein